LVTGRLLAAEIVEPQEGKTYTGQATLSVESRRGRELRERRLAFPTALD